MFGSTDTSTKHFRYLNASLSMGEISLPCLMFSWCWSLVSDGGLGRCRRILKWGSPRLKPHLVQGSPRALGGRSPVCSFSRACWKVSRWLHVETLPRVLEMCEHLPGFISVMCSSHHLWAKNGRVPGGPSHARFWLL